MGAWINNCRVFDTIGAFDEYCTGLIMKITHGGVGALLMTLDMFCD